MAARKPEPRATIQTRLKICGEWQPWAQTVDGQIAKSTAIDLAKLRQADVLHPVKEYRVLDVKGRVIWPEVTR